MTYSVTITPLKTTSQLFLNWMEHRHNFHIDPSWVSLSDGVMPAVNTALRSVTRPGDKVIIQRPVYYPFTFAAEHNGLTILDNELVLDENGHYGIDFDDLESKARRSSLHGHDSVQSAQPGGPCLDA